MVQVAVIVPAHNASATISAALESIAAQTECDWQVTVIDDGSSDQTAELVERFGPAFQLVQNPVALGPAGARNRGLALARESDPEFYAFLDADDTWDSTYLASQLSAFERCSSAGRRVGIVACDARLSVNGELRRESWLAEAGSTRTPDLTDMLRRNRVFISALVPAYALEAAGGEFDEGLWGTEDYDLWLRIIELGYDVCVNQTILATYSDDAGSVSADTPRQSRNVVIALQKALRRGRLSTRQRLVAKSSIQFHEAQALVADLLRGNESVFSTRFLSALPRLAAVVLIHPRLWSSWAKAAMSFYR